MASPRLIFLLVCLLVLPTFLAFFSLLYTNPQGEDDGEASSRISESGIRAFFALHTPSALFPPSAIISLTDDNSTFFLARPAAFGPGLPTSGLSGQLWVGSGFGDDTIGRGGAATGAEGELGCSDVPGWEFRSRHSRGVAGTFTTDPIDVANGPSKIPEAGIGPSSSSDQPESSSLDSDGTDDHLHQDLAGSETAKNLGNGEAVRQRRPHADIQSLQESAEIAGRVVLLSRGGCGFLEKVKWAQRRGGTALIVGDDTRGGALVTMYAHGDTSNVTIPSLFTSHTTAHLLSSLIPLDGSIDAALSGEAIRSSASQGRNTKVATAEQGNAIDDSNGNRPTIKAGPSSAKPTFSPELGMLPAMGKGSSPKPSNRKSSNRAESKSWLGTFASKLGISSKSKDGVQSADTTRSLTSDRSDWANRKRKDISDQGVGQQRQSGAKRGASSAPRSSGDDFIIGVQDWRDPDLVTSPSSLGNSKHDNDLVPMLKPSTSKPAIRGETSPGRSLAGGIITPGSGEYGKPDSKNHGSEHFPPDQTRKSTIQDSALRGSKIRPIPAEDQGGQKPAASARIQLDRARKLENESRGKQKTQHKLEEHEGLWVTLTPTTMSTSPFFDTLLVLVVSPLVTLTVVYALLLLRSRIRRRRWRAPKALVDRLPVRIYNTISCSSTSSSPKYASPKNSTPATPLLQTSPRPRSRTTSGVGESHQSLLNKAATKLDQPDKGPRRPVWMKNFASKQVECVVCLEEYVDGHSRVMSLPCGHEFHAECITPWLTTRRRTCPICKCDVVRSMTPHFSPSAQFRTRYADDHGSHDNDFEAQATDTSIEPPSSAIPIPRSVNSDLESGNDDMAATLVNDQPEPSQQRRSWMDLASLSLSAFSGEAAWRQARVDRNR